MVLAEDTQLEDMVKLGLGNEHTKAKADQMGEKNEDMFMRPIIQDKVRQI